MVGLQLGYVLEAPGLASDQREVTAQRRSRNQQIYGADLLVKVADELTSDTCELLHDGLIERRKDRPWMIVVSPKGAAVRSQE